MVEVSSTFKERLVEALWIRHKKPIDLSKGTGIAEASISQYRSGRVVPKEKKIAAISSFLNVNPAWLLGYNVPMQLCSADRMGNCSKISIEEVRAETQLSAREVLLIEKYRNADKIDRRCVNRILGMDGKSA